MSFLTEEFDDSFKLDGKVYHVNLAFDNVLLLFEMFDDGSILDNEKILLTLEMLIVEYEQLQFESAEQVIMLYKYLMKEFLGYDTAHKPDAEKEKTYDFQKDAELIFASFFSAYNMDLIEQKGKLHWKKFITMLKHLDEKTAFKNVVKIRTMKIPKVTEHNKDDIAELRKAKEFYSLDDRPAEEKMNDVFNVVAHAFKGGKKAGE